MYSYFFVVPIALKMWQKVYCGRTYRCEHWSFKVIQILFLESKTNDSRQFPVSKIEVIHVNFNGEISIGYNYSLCSSRHCVHKTIEPVEIPGVIRMATISIITKYESWLM